MTTAGTTENRTQAIRSAASNSRLCPDCGGNMKEAERVYEGDFIFVWYQCQIDNCDGQWLQRYEKEKIAS